MAAKLQTKEVGLFLLFQWLDDRKLYRMYHCFWLYPAHDFLVRSYLPYLLFHKKMLQFQRVAVDSGQMVDCERVGSFVNQNGEGTKQWYQCSPKVCWENQCLLEYLSHPSLVYPSSASPCLLSVSTELLCCTFGVLALRDRGWGLCERELSQCSLSPVVCGEIKGHWRFMYGHCARK